jgi:hypothetical protein
MRLCSDRSSVGGGSPSSDQIEKQASRPKEMSESLELGIRIPLSTCPHDRFNWAIRNPRSVCHLNRLGSVIARLSTENLIDFGGAFIQYR